MFLENHTLPRDVALPLREGDAERFIGNAMEQNELPSAQCNNTAMCVER